jgi:hypothetical protein
LNSAIGFTIIPAKGESTPNIPPIYPKTSKIDETFLV